ncbi:MAG: ATPase, T2SS/T4P/T4SS family [Planctomycetota bacterium]
MNESDLGRAEMLDVLAGELGDVVMGEIRRRSARNLFVVSSGAVVAEGVDGNRRLLATTFSRVQLSSLMSTMVGLLDIDLLEEDASVLGSIPEWGVRVAGVGAPPAKSPFFTFRVMEETKFTMEGLVGVGMLTSGWALGLREALVDGSSVVILGRGGSGKTTLARALLEELIEERPMERIVTLEDASEELSLSGALCDSLVVPEGGDMGAWFRRLLRVQPDRIVIGECRGAEVLAWLEAELSGHGGSVMTVHSESIEELIPRLRQMMEVAGGRAEDLTLARALDVVVHCERDMFGSIRVASVGRFKCNGRKWSTEAWSA